MTRLTLASLNIGFGAGMLYNQESLGVPIFAIGLFLLLEHIINYYMENK